MRVLRSVFLGSFSTVKELGLHMIVTIGEKNLTSRSQFMKVCLLRLPCQSFKNKEYVLVVFHIRCNNSDVRLKHPWLTNKEAVFTSPSHPIKTMNKNEIVLTLTQAKLSEVSCCFTRLHHSVLMAKGIAFFIWFVDCTLSNNNYYQYTWPNRKSASSKHTLSGPQKTDSGLLMHYQPYS